MLDQLDLERSIDKHEYKTRLNTFQNRMYDLQQALFDAHRPVVIVFEGWAGTSKVSIIRQWTNRLDPRMLRVYPITPPRTYETMYPWLYRFWQKIPSYGQMALFDRSWYRQVLAARTSNKTATAEWRSLCEDIVAFERQLADDGAIILKFWLHISQKEQAHRFEKLQSDPLTSWQITDEDHWQNKHYKKVYAAVEDMAARTDMPYAPWVLLPATNQRFAQVAVFEALVGAIEGQLGTVAGLRSGSPDEAIDASGAIFRRGLAAAPHSELVSARATDDNGHATSIAATVPATPLLASGILSCADLSVKLEPKVYERELAELQAKLHLLGFQVYLQKRPVVLVFEGWDAAGKGGAIKRITEQLDPRSYIVHAIAAPSGDDKSRHYLYRFWRRLPPQGNIGIFDRSWYGRVLVERIEGFARPDEWQRAFAEINEFERQLVEFGTIVCKFWVHISPEEQLRRFEERQNVRYKAWKLTDEDWRNREKWPQYQQAADEMLLRTSTPAAPWTLVELEDKRFGRVKVLRTLVRRLEEELGRIKL